MAEFLSPGVFIEEYPSQVQTIQGVSTSNLGIVGFTTKGPTDTAVLVTSYDRFVQMFGDLTRDSITPLSAAAYFANGGRRLYVVRVVPSDAVAADAKIQSEHVNVQVGTGAGTTAITGTINTHTGSSPIVPSLTTLRWRASGTLQTNTPTVKRDGTTALVGNGTWASFEGRLNPTTLPTVDESLHAVLPTAITLDWTKVGLGGVETVSLSTVSGFYASGTGGTGGDTVAASLDLRTGVFTLDTNGDSIPDVASPITGTYTSTAAKSATADAAGTFVGNVTGGTVDHETGVLTTVVADAAIFSGCPILADYAIDAWDMNPVSKGSWGNDIRVEIKGNQDYFTASTGSYTRFNVLVKQYNSSTLGYDIVEQYEELVFNDPTAAKYFPDVVNDLSDYVSVTAGSADEAPDSLQANGPFSRVIAAGGDGTNTGLPTITAATISNLPVQPRSVTISYTSGAVSKTVTDNGAGALIGDVDPADTNVISYTLGTVSVKLSVTPDVGTFVVVSYYQSPDASHQFTFGDQTKYTWSGSAIPWTLGANGTFDDTYYWRTQVSSFAALADTYSGLYALSRVRDLMQVVIPDFVGDMLITQDLIDYCDLRATNPEGGDRFAIIQPLSGYSAQEAVDWLRYELLRSSKYVACYWPWLKVSDPARDNRAILMPAVAHIAGIYARTDATRTVAKAPAGTVDGLIRFALELEVVPERGDLDTVSPAKINALISDPTGIMAVWGVRTLSPTSEWKWANVVRTFMFVERSVYNSTQWVIFENNNATLWSRIQSQVAGFLNDLFNNGYFAGTSPSQAFRVVCDASNNGQTSIDNGQVICDIGIAPNKPAEFLRFRVSQRTLSS